MDLVVGATGFLGGEICRRLTERGRALRALVRSTSDPTRVEQLRGLGAEIVLGDLRDTGSMDAACRGVDTVVSTATAMLRPDRLDEVDAAGQLNLVDRAQAAGVGRFVFTSTSLSSALSDHFPLLDAKRAVEARLIVSGLPYTILRPTFFMDVWLSPLVGFDPANARAQIFGEGTQPISWIALGDVAELATHAVINPAHQNRTFGLGGPQALSPLDVVGIYEELGARKFEVTHVPVDSLQAQFAGATDPKQQSFAGLMLGYARGDVIDMTATLRELPVRLTSVRQHAEQILAMPAVV
jgi:uncharacterized protein YbjT (DUF2867 family)